MQPTFTNCCFSGSSSTYHRHRSNTADSRLQVRRVLTIAVATKTNTISAHVHVVNLLIPPSLCITRAWSRKPAHLLSLAILSSHPRLLLDHLILSSSQSSYHQLLLKQASTNGHIVSLMQIPTEWLSAGRSYRYTCAALYTKSQISGMSHCSSARVVVTIPLPLSHELSDVRSAFEAVLL